MKRKASPEKLALIASPECTVGMLEVFSQDPLLAEAVVQNPSCPPSILARLSFHSRGLQKLIVQNPNTPKSLLLPLGEKHPKEFLQNPILWLISLEDPGFWSSAPDSFLEKILTRADAPFDTICQALLSDLLRHSDSLLLVLARHPDTPAPAILQLAGCWQPRVRWAASKHPKLPGELVEVALAEFLRADINEEAPQAKLYQDEVPPLTSAVLCLCARGGPWLRYVAASDLSTPPEVLEELTRDPDSRIWGAAIENPSQTPEALHRLLSTALLHSEISKNPSASSGTLLAIWEAHQRGNNPHIDHGTRLHLAQNPSTPEALLRELYALGEAAIWQGLAQNPSCPPELVQRFEGLGLLEFLALNPSVPKALLSRIAASGDDKARRNAAKNPSLSREDLARLAHDASAEVRRQVAARLDLTAALQVSLAIDKDPTVQKALSRTRARQERALKIYPKS